MNLPRILLADDHQLFREGIKLLIEQAGCGTVIGQAESGGEAETLAEELRPDLILIDLRMPDQDGILTTRAILKRAPETKIIVLSGFNNANQIRDAMAAGARGYLTKTSSPEEVRMAIRTVFKGQQYLAPAVAPQLFAASTQKGLTPRQSQILQLVADGRSTKEIADVLNLSVKTVEAHRAKLMERLNVRDVASLVRTAITEGLVS